MEFQTDVQSSNGFKEKFERWFVRNYGTPEELEKHGFQKRGFFSFNVIEIGMTLVFVSIIYSIFY